MSDPAALNRAKDAGIALREAGRRLRAAMVEAQIARRQVPALEPEQVIVRIEAMHRSHRQAARTKAALAIAGTDGGAMIRRKTRHVETIQAGVRLAEMQDADPLTAMQLTRLQTDAAAYLRDLWRDCLPVTQMPGGYGNGAGHGGERHLSHDEWLAGKRAWQDYRQAMDRLWRRWPAAHNAVVNAVLRSELAPAGLVAQGLDVLASEWRMR